MCEFNLVREFCPCAAEARCRRAGDGVQTPYGLRHCINPPFQSSVVCRARAFIMSREAFPLRECPNTSAASRTGPTGDGHTFRPASKICKICADFCVSQ